MIGFIAADHLTHTVVIHTEAIITSRLDSLVEQFQSAVLKSTFHPIFISGIEIGQIHAAGFVAGYCSHDGRQIELHCQCAQLHAGHHIGGVAQRSIGMNLHYKAAGSLFLQILTQPDTPLMGGALG